MNCSVGYVMTGQNAKYAVFGCENCENEVWIPSADSSHFGPAYLEDARTSGGQGTVQFRVGKTADAASDVVHCTFENILLLRGAGNTKQAFQFRASYVNTYTGCRAYGGPNSVDNVSTGTLINCDFTVSRFTSNISSEGSWAPVIGDSWGNYFSTTVSTGQYSRNGNVVTAVARVAWSSKGSAGASPLILTLPIPARNASELKQAVTIGDYSGLNTIRPVTANILPDTSLMTFHWVDNSNVWSDLFANQCNNGGELVVSMTYLI
ncbi:hypothetical protein [Sphingomonas cavernae]|uniref:Uncharacterized protein n=1 Tax=Sphingomonas cavernae TaxID=2320861 RepID=A0A418W748_9SPHN|nr:hypothetical protein [Sphingomonas cavernae]RJF85798.1 hypothetical protein D3876_18150 [Sphingomonas cavernae]